MGVAMDPIGLFSLASRKTAWLAARQATVATNIANANMPGYQARDVASFNDVLAKTRLDVASTEAGHLQVGGPGSGDAAVPEVTDDAFDVTESGNTVGLEQQMIRSGEINRDYALTTNIVRSFHAMLMASLKE